jgi:hypothetical protein
MNTTDIKKAKRIRNTLVAISAGLGVVGILALWYPATDPLSIRCVSAVVCLGAAVMWLLPALPKVSYCRCLNVLVFANLLLLLGWGQIDKLLYRAKWDAIYGEVARLTGTSPFDFDVFASSLSHVLRGGKLLSVGIVAVWLLNILALMYLAQTEKDKEANKAPEDTARKLADPQR